MKKKNYYIVLLLCLFFNLTSVAQEGVKLTFQDGISGPLKSNMESSATALLTEINAAFAEKRSLNTVNLNMTLEARIGLSALWENVNFYCDDVEVIQSCLQTSVGYQVRQIPLMLNGSGDSAGEEYQEAVINFDKSGKIIRFNLTVAMNIYQNIMKQGLSVEDISQRQQILSYVEHFRTAYNEKDINFLERIFSDDAIIITGTVIKLRTLDGQGFSHNKVTYRKQNKQEYISRLKNSFAVNKYIRVRFDNVKIRKHPNPSYEGFYGVTVEQSYSNSSGYSDEGYLFLLWDFRDPDNVLIHVRTWQPMFMNDSKTVELPKEDVFQAGDFNIQL